MFGGLAGWLIVDVTGPITTTPPRFIEFLASSGLGFLVGGGLVWLIRILGTLAFGREAMGMGDVHLLAAIGAALGWIDPIRIFFIAPFLALGWLAGGRILSLFKGGQGRELPYGPHLAAATILVVYARPWLDELQRGLFMPPG
jgi:leader peptidase (prepilin peptidase)/N-methyltransferase